MSIEKIYEWSWPYTKLEQAGYDYERVPDLSAENFQFLADKFNELVDALNEAQAK